MKVGEAKKYLSLLIEYGLGVNEMNPYTQMTPLISLCSLQAETDLLQVLFDAGANPNLSAVRKTSTDFFYILEWKITFTITDI